MQKIMFFTPSLNVGGIERIMLTYAQGLAQHNYSVIYVICHDKGVFTGELKQTAIRLINLKTMHLRHSVSALSKILHLEKPDIIFTANDATLIVILAKWLACIHCKIITSQHSYISDNESNTLRSWLVIRFFFRFCYKIIAVSQGIEKMLVESLKLPVSKVCKIYNPIDIKRIQYLSEIVYADIPSDYIVFVGRLSPVKNLSFLLDAFAKFSKAHGTIKLVIVGDGEDRDMICQKSLDLKIQDKVIMLGTRANPYPYIKNARVVVLPSLSEAFPTILIESMVLGKTIVATPTLGAQEILCRSSLGYISASFDDSIEFATLLDKGFESPIAPSLLYQEVQKFNLSNKINELSKLF